MNAMFFGYGSTIIALLAEKPKVPFENYFSVPNRPFEKSK